jgi:SMC interacting uncharacterized protein involved in chromosome segregation
MANVFGILTAIVLAVSAFVAFKNKAAYQESIEQTRTRKQELVKSKARLAAAEEKMNVTLPGAIAGLNSEVDQLTVDEAKQKKANDELTAKVETTTKTIASNKVKLDTASEKIKNMGDLNLLAAKIKTMNAEIVDIVTETDSTSAKLANLTAQNASTEGQVTSTKSKFESFANGESLPSVNTRIRSIYPNWGFVTLASGNNVGVVTNSTLNVVRDGKTIAQLLVTAVESTTASASIVPDSMAPDVTLMVGDRVVPGLKATKPAGN